MLVVLLHIHPCYLTGVAWTNGMLVKKCDVSGFAPYYLSGVAWTNGMLVKKCHVSGFAPYPTLLCEWCLLKKCATLR